MRQFTKVVLCISFLFSATSRADEAGVKLSKEYLATFIPGTRVVYVIKGGSTHRWTNEFDGKFAASTDAKTINLIGAGSYTAPGNWHISDDGKYCVEINWKRYPESWCRFIFRRPDGGYYMTDTDDANAERHNIELTK